MSVAFSRLTSRRKAKRGLTTGWELNEKISGWPTTVPTEDIIIPEIESFYPEDIENIRKREFPLLQGVLEFDIARIDPLANCSLWALDTTYLDHGGATLYAQSLIEKFSSELVSNVFGNPHSASPSSQLSTQRVDDARLRLLAFFNASPDEFDIVFVANATAAVKLVVEALRDYDDRGFWYGYHMDCHTSLVGPRNVAVQGSKCFLGNGDVEEWIESLGVPPVEGGERPAPKLFAYPGQSNMTGSRLGLKWCADIRRKTQGRGDVFTLYDAAAYVSSSPLDLSDLAFAPDFIAMSLYKIFGFPDLGALIVRKSAGHIFEKRRYFGGGTVGMVISLGSEWHAKKDSVIHEGLEDGTLPFHNIVALHSALDVHSRLYGSMHNISRHTAALVENLFTRLNAMRHFNGEKVCEMYTAKNSTYGDPTTQGPVIAFNLKNSQGSWIGKSEVEKLAAVRNIHIRSGGLCNPGGIATYLHLTAENLRHNYAEGQRCGDENDIMGGRPAGVLRVSLGAMSNLRDVDTFVNFVSEFFVEKSAPAQVAATIEPPSKFYIEKLAVYPIKSCGSFSIPEDKQWEVRPEGLAWDREWCLVHLGTNAALSQKKYPKMALIQPTVDLEKNMLRVTCRNPGAHDERSVEIPLSADDDGGHSTIQLCQSSKQANVCGDSVTVRVYSSLDIAAFFSNFLGTHCTLARFPPQSSVRHYQPRASSSKPNNRRIGILSSAVSKFRIPSPSQQPSILLSNESPILIVSRSSVNRLNEEIKGRKGAAKTVPSDVFRANIVVAEDLAAPKAGTANYSRLPRLLSFEHPYAEDRWTGFKVGDQAFDVLSSCQRCQMVCIDQETSARSDEPYSTLAKTRKINGKVYFGRHACLSNASLNGNVAFPTVKVGDRVLPSYEEI